VVLVVIVHLAHCYMPMVAQVEMGQLVALVVEL
jgi:hypothetical protein